MVELKKTDIIKKQKNRYIHNIKVTYPKENVNNMIDAWQKKVEEVDEWLTNNEDNMNQIIEESKRQMDYQIEHLQKEVEEMLSKPLEEKIELWKKEEQKLIKEKQDYIKNKDEMKKELENNIRKENENIKKEVLSKHKQKKEALEFWKKATQINVGESYKNV